MSDEIKNLADGASSDLLVEKQATIQKQLNSCGALLVVARESREWSVQYVADQLKLSARQISALESNQFEVLPTPVVVRGFVRSYAKLLKIDAEPLIALLPGDANLLPNIGGFNPTLTTPFQESRLPMLGHQDDNSGRYIWWAIIFVLLAAGFFVLQRFEQDGTLPTLMQRFSSSASEAELESAASEAASVSDAMNPIISMAETSSSQVFDAVPASISVANESILAAVASVTSPASAVSSASVVAASSASSWVNLSASLPITSDVSSAARGFLRLKFRQDSWIQVKRENGDVLNSHLAKAGTEEILELKEPLQIRIGNAAGVDVQLRGVPLAIAGLQGNNVANIVVK